MITTPSKEGLEVDIASLKEQIYDMIKNKDIKDIKHIKSQFETEMAFYEKINRGHLRITIMLCDRAMSSVMLPGRFTAGGESYRKRSNEEIHYNKVAGTSEHDKDMKDFV